MNETQQARTPAGYPQQRTLHPTSYALPLTGYLRLNQIIGTLAASPRKKRRETRQTEVTFYPPLVPISKTTLWDMVKKSKFPAPVKLSERCTAWRVEDVKQWLEKAAA